jgi:hypothetical protein
VASAAVFTAVALAPFGCGCCGVGWAAGEPGVGKALEVGSTGAVMVVAVCTGVGALVVGDVAAGAGALVAGGVVGAGAVAPLGIGGGGCGGGCVAAGGDCGD